MSSHDAPTGPDEPADSGVPAGDEPTQAATGHDRVTAAAGELRLMDLAREIERHVGSEGWDQPARMFALARTAELVALEPALAAVLEAEAADPHSLTPIEQERLDTSRPLDEVLATTTWPPEVAGAALVLERIVLPPEVEESLPDDEAELEAIVAEHPDRQDVRMAVVVLREGGRMCVLRLRSHDEDADVLVGADVVPRLADALAATLR